MALLGESDALEAQAIRNVFQKYFYPDGIPSGSIIKLGEDYHFVKHAPDELPEFRPIDQSHVIMMGPGPENQFPRKVKEEAKRLREYWATRLEEERK